MINIGINGFGRIGRTCFRIISSFDDCNVSVINDTISSNKNICYLLNYDSHYGSLKEKYNIEKQCLVGDSKKIPILHLADISEVNWHNYDVQIVIDASGIGNNVVNAHKLKNICSIITHSPTDNVDNYIVMGVNESTYRKDQKVISSSICDVNGAAHVVKPIMDTFGIKNGFSLTLHPWLSYQNLVDGPVVEQRNPKHYWKDFSLGRASVNTLIPKPTTFLTAMENIIPSISSVMNAISYRVPTNLVAVADMTIQLNRNSSVNEMNNFLESLESEYVQVNKESLVSHDYIKMDQAVAIDIQWTKVMDDIVHIVCWYDNEWSYSSSVVKLARFVASKQLN
jgi:glyceraldehyde 3-phosphate dehydrogenase